MVHHFYFRATSGSYAETQKINAIRKAYHVSHYNHLIFVLNSVAVIFEHIFLQQVVLTPLMNIEQMWRDYCNFEQVYLDRKCVPCGQCSY